MYKKLDQQDVDCLRQIVGMENVIDDREKILDYSHDEFSLLEIAREPDVVVKPDSTQEIEKILAYAEKERLPVTPRGGATGLCGGCVPRMGGIVLSLERMNRIIEIDLKNQMAVVEAGVTLMDFYAKVESAGLFFPPHPGDESAMIGGVVATNAGGSRAVKYGVVRNYIRGLEVVLPSGKTIHPGGKLMKSSTGYNLLNLFIGSEGTLGVITKAIIQLMPLPRMSRSLIVPYEELNKAIETVPLLIKEKIQPLAVEFIPLEVIRITEDFLRKKWPGTEGNTFLLIIIDASSDAEMDALSEEIAGICLDAGALDVYVADNPQRQALVLEIRSMIYEAIKAHTIEILDIVVPRAEIALHVEKVRQVAEKYDIWLPTFGHAADGNVHTHIMSARFQEGKIIPLPENQWRDKIELIRKDLYQDCRERGGKISGEHGIGQVKIPYLHYVLSEDEISLMKGIKNVFDPHGILNPGKILP
ncbi:MAG TPA: FAD-binding oxidoreductase [Bacteroidaceae bacterium]|nr:FAD-binding oxidoreductase [Bacteroidaceae bacterium]